MQDKKCISKDRDSIPYAVPLPYIQIEEKPPDQLVPAPS